MAYKNSLKTLLALTAICSVNLLAYAGNNNLNIQISNQTNVEFQAARIHIDDAIWVSKPIPALPPSSSQNSVTIVAILEPEMNNNPTEDYIAGFNYQDKKGDGCSFIINYANSQKNYYTIPLQNPTKYICFADLTAEHGWIYSIYPKAAND